MRAIWRPLFGGLLLGLALPWLALADAEIDEAELTRARLAKLLDHPEQRARLLRNLRHFQSLSAEKQQRLRQFERDYRELDSREAAQLQRVLERYANWQQNLPEDKRRILASAANDRERIRLIKELRDEQWIERLPKSQRDPLWALSSQERATKVAELRKDERKRREDWRLAFRNWGQIMQKRPAMETLRDHWPEVEEYIKNTLTPMLSMEEKQVLANARKGHRALLAKTVLALSDRHPVRLPGPSKGPTKFEELPEALKLVLPELKEQPPTDVRNAQGRWPDYAIQVTQFARRQNKELPKQLGPSRPAEFSKDVQEFLETSLRPRLEPSEHAELLYAAGSWPRYPVVINQLARKYGLQVPGLALPGPREAWDVVRLMRPPQVGELPSEGSRATASADTMPDVPDRTLHEFVRSELSAEDKGQLPSMSLADPAHRERIQELYFQRHPEERKRLNITDRKKARNKK